MKVQGMRLSTAAASLALGLASVFVAAGASAQESPGTVYKDWTVHCNEQAAQQVAGGCLMTQFAIDKETSRPVMQIQVAYAPDAKDPVAVIILPLGVLLQPGVAVQVDRNQAIKLPFGWCLTDGCRVRLPLDQAMLKQFQAGNGGVIGFRVIGGQDRALPFSLSGFTAALASLK